MKFCRARSWVGIIAILLAIPAMAQTTLQLTFNLDVNYLFGDPVNYYWGSGTVAPLGSATLSGTYDAGNISLDIGLPSGGDSFTIASSTIVAGPSGCIIIGAVTAGIGTFTNATGSANLVYAPCGPQEVGAGSIVVTGRHGHDQDSERGSVQRCPKKANVFLSFGQSECADAGDFSRQWNAEPCFIYRSDERTNLVEHRTDRWHGGRP